MYLENNENPCIAQFELIFCCEKSIDNERLFKYKKKINICCRIDAMQVFKSNNRTIGSNSVILQEK